QLLPRKRFVLADAPAVPKGERAIVVERIALGLAPRDGKITQRYQPAPAAPVDERVADRDVHERRKIVGLRLLANGAALVQTKKPFLDRFLHVLDRTEPPVPPHQGRIVVTKELLEPIRKIGEGGAIIGHAIAAGRHHERGSRGLPKNMKY